MVEVDQEVEFAAIPPACLADIARVTYARLKGKGLKLLHHYPDQLWAMGDKTVPNAGFTAARIFPSVSRLRLSVSLLCRYILKAALDRHEVMMSRTFPW